MGLQDLLLVIREVGEALIDLADWKPKIIFIKWFSKHSELIDLHY